MTTQGDRQAAIRASTGTALTYEGDWHALFDQAGITKGDFNGRLLAWINSQGGSNYVNVNEAMQAFAAANGFFDWSAMNTVPVFFPTASLALDFLTGRYRVGAGGGYTSNFASLSGLTVSRASVGWDDTGTIQFGVNVARIVPGKGLLVEEARTNLFLNSFAPGTQTITLGATGNYTITVWGSGSVTVAAGTATITGGGAASAGSPRTINCTVVGTITVTVSGSPSIVQVEAGAFGTSPIQTAGASATRAADSVKITGLSALPVGTLLARGSSQVPTSGQVWASLNDGTNNNRVQIGGGITFWVTSAGVASGTIGSGTYTAGTPYAGAFMFQSASYRGSANGGAVVSSATPAGAVPAYTQLTLGADHAAAFSIDGYLTRVLLYPRAFSDAELQAASQ